MSVETEMDRLWKNAVYEFFKRGREVLLDASDAFNAWKKLAQVQTVNAVAPKSEPSWVPPPIPSWVKVGAKFETLELLGVVDELDEETHVSRVSVSVYKNDGTWLRREERVVGPNFWVGAMETKRSKRGEAL